MKRGICFIALFTFITFIFSAVSVLAQGYGYSTSGFAGLPSIAELVNNEWVNAAIIFLFVFAFVWFVTQQVFRASRPAAIVISIVLALVAAFGVVYMYGPIIARFGNLIFFAVFAGIILLLWFQFRHSRAIVFIALAIASIIWLLFLHRYLCPPVGLLFQELCIILDVIAVALLLIAIIRLLGAFFRKLREGVMPKGPREPKGPKGPKAPEEVELVIEATPGGTTNPSPGAHYVEKNSTVTIVPIPYHGHDIVYWIVDGRRIRAYSLTIRVPRRMYVRAVFSRGGEAPGKPERPEEPERERRKEVEREKKKEERKREEQRKIAEEKRKAITYEEKKMLPAPSAERRRAEINRIKGDLTRVQQIADREMKKGAKANQQRIDKLLAMRDRLMKRLHEVRG